jgi:DNA-binding CsgD family transcriptional regulator
MSNEFMIDAPHFMEALNDDGAAEILRQMQLASIPLSVRALSERLSQPADWLQSRLDILSSAGLVSAVRAGRGHRSIRYAAVAPPIRVRFREGHPEDASRLSEFVRVVRARIERKIEEVGGEGRPRGPTWSFDSLSLPVMSAKERDELISRVRRVIEFLGMLEQRRGARNAGRQSAGERAEPSTQHVVEIRVRPLRSVLTPELSVDFFADRSEWPKGMVPGCAVASLAPRELQVARALAEGLSRPQIAKLLGLSPNTVATISARIHRKLGVRSRAELTRVVLNGPTVRAR